MARKAASYAAQIRHALDVAVVMEEGRRGQFDVFVDGRKVVSRKGGLIAKLIGRPWPDPDDVVAAVRAAAAGGDDA